MLRRGRAADTRPAHWTRLIAALAMLSSPACFPPYAPVAEESVPDVRFGTLEVQGHALYYAQAGDPSKPMVLMIHGTPGSWQGFAPFLEDPLLRSHAHLVAPDRPGFGASRDRDWLPDLATQARLLMAFAALDHSGRPLLLVGHSLGATIAYRMGVDFPDRVGGIVAIAGGIDPQAARARWYNHLANGRLVHWAVPEELARANREIMPLEGALAAMAPLLGRLSGKVTAIHGRRDKLVSFANLAYVEDEIPGARIVPVADAGHFVIWNRPELIRAEILMRLEALSAKGANRVPQVQPTARR